LNNNHSCQDIDECLIGSHNCPQLCTNTIGGFSCSCYEGYDINNNCADIDECLNKTLIQCIGECYNYPGGFICRCKTGYSLNDGVCKANPCVTSQWSDWYSCTDCRGSNIKRNRTVDIDKSDGSPDCVGDKTPVSEYIQQLLSPNKILTPEAVLYALKDQFIGNSWLKYQFQHALNTSLTVTEITKTSKRFIS